MTLSNQVASPRRRRAAEDGQRLKDLDAKLQMVRDRVAGVAKGYTLGLYLRGEGGVGKSFTVLQELLRLRAHFVLFNSRMTGRALYDQLAASPSSVHVLEDMEALFHDKNAQGVLRSALWAQRKQGSRGPLPRMVTWNTHKIAASFTFTGGIIAIANRPLDDVPELRALRTRITCLHLEVTPYEMHALMRHVAAKGCEHDDKKLDAAACREVVEYLIVESAQMGRTPEMRLLVNSFKDRIQWEEGHAVCHWRDLVAARLQERVTGSQDAVPGRRRALRKREEHKVVAEILAASQDRLDQMRMWAERTGKSQAAWYRRRAEVPDQPASGAEK
jgi:hypothetical protein